MKKTKPRKSSPRSRQRLSFQSKIERLAAGMEYYAVSVPVKTSQALQTRGPVPVFARVNGSESFLASLYPVGGGRHYLRVKNRICKSVKVKEGDLVNVAIQVRDRSAEISIPPDLMRALKAEGMVEDFKALPIGQKSFLLRLIDKAVKPETRAKRIDEAVEEAHRRREKRIDRKSVSPASAKAGK